MMQMQMQMARAELMGTTQFKFAGFTWPRAVATLPRKSISARLADWKQHHKLHPFCGPYTHAPKPIDAGNLSGHQTRFFYHRSDFAPGLRHVLAYLCDTAPRNVKSERAWFTDEHHGETITGVVFRLNHGRGFLAGWTMGEHMASELSVDVAGSERDAADWAHDMARNAAEAQREEYEKYKREQAREDAQARLCDAREHWLEALAALRALRALKCTTVPRPGDVFDSLYYAMDCAKRDCLAAVSELRQLAKGVQP